MVTIFDTLDKLVFISLFSIACHHYSSSHFGHQGLRRKSSVHDVTKVSTNINTIFANLMQVCICDCIWNVFAQNVEKFGTRCLVVSAFSPWVNSWGQQDSICNLKIRKNALSRRNRNKTKMPRLSHIDADDFSLLQPKAYLPIEFILTSRRVLWIHKDTYHALNAMEKCRKWK